MVELPTPTPSLSHVPGGFIETPGTTTPRTASRQPSQLSTRSNVTIRQNEAAGSQVNPHEEQRNTHGLHYHDHIGAGGLAGIAAVAAARSPTDNFHRCPPEPSSTITPSNDVTPTATNTQSHARKVSNPSEGTTRVPPSPEEEVLSAEDAEKYGLHEDEHDPHLEPIKATATAKDTDHEKTSRPGSAGRAMSQDDIFRALSRRRTSHNLSREQTQEQQEEQEEINRLMTRLFGKTRQANSEEEKTRHVGVVWKNLTIKGMGLGAALQPSTGDVFLGLPRKISALFSRNKSAKSKPPVRTILDDFTGSIKPGEMCLVLGRPGAGCSTFLKVIGNQRFGYENIDGTVTYGGTEAKEMLKKYRGEVLYNPEDDLHYATLKVQQTLKFALTTKAPGKASRKEGETKKEYINEFLKVISKLFWIEHTMNTKVGNEFVRGVSGGEKKRVSIAEAMITRASTQCWDNSTKGLDASTALEYVSSLRSLTNMTHISTAVALYQAGESLYDLFDKVLLIEDGKCCYFGPTDKAAQYFKDLGFVQPDRWTSADFLTSVVDEHERHIKDGYEDRIPRSAQQFSDIFRDSQQAKDNVKEIEVFEEDTKAVIEERRSNQQSKETQTKNYSIGFPQQVWACTKRQWLVMLGDRQSLIGKWGGILFQALIVGSLFYNLPSTASGAFTRGGVLFFMLLFNALLALAELNAAFESRPILLKHKSFSFYRPAAYAIAQTVIDIPLVFVQNVIFNVVVYFMANLQRTASQFFISLLFIFSITMCMYAFFRCVGATFGSLDAATRVTGVALQVLIVYTGYLIPPGKMHPWFSWLRWINPVQYAFEGLMANEFYDLTIECVPPYIVPQVPGADPENQSCALQGSQPGQTQVQGANYIDVAFGYRRSHLWRNFGIIWAFFFLFVLITVVGMEMQKPNKGGGSVTIYKRGQAPKSVEKAVEGSSKPADLEDGGKEKDLGTSSADEDEENQTANAIAGNDSVFTFQDVNYRIPVKGGERQLLENVQGFVRPGKLTALMGASGAGKTTLLNTLAQRIRFGVVTGDFMVDGNALPKSFQRSSGFAEQMDIHEPTATVREALRFSAKLRQPKEVPLQEKYDYCEKIIDLLEMRSIAGAVVGVPGSGLNQEQRKRLTIGVELASKPELLMFLDEPTSGLDSAAAFNILRFLRKLANAGQAILCTIHQPSSVLFENFDALLLLKSGGRTVYFGDLGEGSKTLINYLERNGSKKIPDRVNPAEFMLEAIGAGNPDYKGQDWGDVWQKSEENAAVGREIQEIVEERRKKASESSAVKDDREFAMPLTTQIATVVHRSFVAMWRSQDYVVGMFMLHILTGLFNSFTFWHLGNSSVDMQSRLFSIFMTLTIAPPLIQQLQPRFLDARNIFESRESNAKIYSWAAFVSGAIISEIPYRIVAGTIYWCCWYWPTWFPRDTYTSVSMWGMIMIYELFYVTFGQAIAAVSPNELLASLLVPIFFTFVVSFCGVVVPALALPSFWRAWMYWLTPFKWLLESMVALLVHNVPVTCADNELAVFNPPQGQSCDEYAGAFARQTTGYVQTMPNGQCGYCQFADGDQFAASFSIYYANVWRDFGIFWAYIIFNVALIYFTSWLYLQGGRQILDVVTGKKRKEAKLRREKKVGEEKA